MEELRFNKFDFSASLYLSLNGSPKDAVDNDNNDDTIVIKKWCEAITKNEKEGNGFIIV